MAEEHKPEGNGIDVESAIRFARRMENLQAEVDEILARAHEETAPIREDMKALMREVHDAGIGRKEFSAVIRKRKYERKAAHAGDSLDLEQAANFQQMVEAFDRIAASMGELGEAARDKFHEDHPRAA